jgi:PAS domain S-box-containing protein
MISFVSDTNQHDPYTLSSSSTYLKLMAFRIPHLSRSLLVLAVLAGPMIGIGAFRLATEVERDRAQAHLDRRVASAALAIERELAADLETVYALKALFEAGVPVTHERFTAVAERILTRHPSLQALEWIPRIAHGSRNAHEQSWREQGFDGYTITEQTENGELVASGEREWYYPGAFVAPIGGNERAIGFDLGSDPLRGEAIERAAATGEIALTDPVELVHLAAAVNGVLAVLAVFGGASEPAEAGEADLAGFVLAVFRIDQLLEPAQLGPGGVALTGIVFELIDGDGGFWAVRGSTDGLPEQPFSGMSAEQPIEAGGQRWHLVAFPSAEYMKSLQTRQPLLLGATAAFAWELLVGLFFVVGKRSRDRLERRHASLMNNVLESLNDGVIVADRHGKILFANQVAAAVSGTTRSDVSPSEWSKQHGFFVPGTDQPFPPDELPLARAIRGQKIDDVELQVRNPQVPDGIRVSVRGGPMLDGRGQVRGGVVVFRDTTEHKKTEEHLQRLSSAVEQTADSVLITDQRGSIEYVNPAFEATTGYSSAEVLGRNPNILKSGLQSPEYYRELWATILAGEPFRGQTVNRKKNGELYHAEQTITAIKDRDGSIIHFVSVIKDMTERHKLQEQEIEMEFAAKVQRELFPAAPPSLPGYDLAGAAFPAQATSGDYFDFIRISDDALAIVVADVTGHGIGPALVMAEVRAYLRSLFDATDDLVSIMSTINRFLVADLDDNLFVTMILAKLEPASGKCTYVNSGHPCGYIVDRSGEVAAELKSICLPLGLFPELPQCADHEFALNEGDVAVLVTDGILESESPHGEEFGAERLLEVLREHRLDPSREIVERVYSAVREFAHEQEQMDDITIVICKRD